MSHKNKIVICSGAGVSAESGIPTFRNAGGSGLWEKHKLEDVCYLPNFIKNYVACNEFYMSRFEQYKDCLPNYAHIKSSELQELFDVICVTSNIDSLFENAGVKEENIYHIHGKINELVLNFNTVNERILKISSKRDYESAFLDNANYPVKPNVVFFEEHPPLYQVVRNLFSDLTIYDKAIVVGSSELVFNYCEELRYSGFSGEIYFVNTDRNLCIYQKKRCKVKTFNGSAVQFFKQISLDKLGNLVLPSFVI